TSCWPAKDSQLLNSIYQSSSLKPQSHRGPEAVCEQSWAVRFERARQYPHTFFSGRHWRGALSENTRNKYETLTDLKQERDSPTIWKESATAINPLQRSR